MPRPTPAFLSLRRPTTNNTFALSAATEMKSRISGRRYFSGSANAFVHPNSCGGTFLITSTHRVFPPSAHRRLHPHPHTGSTSSAPLSQSCEEELPLSLRMLVQSWSRMLDDPAPHIPLCQNGQGGARGYHFQGHDSIEATCQQQSCSGYGGLHQTGSQRSRW